MPPDNPAWAAVKPPVAFPDPPEPYSLIFLLGFYEDVYANRPSKEDEVEADGGPRWHDPRQNWSQRLERRHPELSVTHKTTPPGCKMPCCNVRGLALFLNFVNIFFEQLSL